MKQYGVKCGRDLPGESVYTNLAQAKRHMKQLEHADEAYDIPRPDGFYKLVEREVTPWRVVKEEATMPSPELKPCPFCGGEARLEIRGYDHKREYRVACSAVHNCGGSQYWFDKQREAVAAWNRRAGEEVQKEMEEKK